MRGTNGASGDNVPFAYIPDRGKRPEKSPERAASIMVENPDGVLCHKESWLEVRNNSEGFAPHPSFIVRTFLLSCVAHWLARNASTDEINLPFLRRPWWKRANVAPPCDVRPMLGQHAAGVVINLNLPPAFHASTLKAKIETANPSE